MAQNATKAKRPAPPATPPAAPAEPKPRPFAGWIAILLALGTLLVYFHSARNEFVNYDDPDYVTSNPQVQAGLTLEGVRWALTTGHASNWHPLTWVSHMLDWQWFGNNPSGHHVMSAAFHALNAALLFLLLRQITGSTWRSAFVAALFALHPLRVESVAWVSERKDVLSGFFFFLTLMAYARSRARELGGIGEPVSTTPANTKRQWLWQGLALLFFALGLMSKPMLVTVPFVLLLLDFWPLGRFQIDDEKQGGLFRIVCRRILEKTPFFLLCAVSSVVTFLVQREGGAVSTSISLGARLANAFVAYVRYLGKFFWPADLSVLYPHPGHWPMWLVAACAVLLLVLSTAAIVFGRRKGYLFTGWFWFLGMMVPVIGLVQVGVQSMADRYTYLPMIGIAMALTWGIYELACTRPGHAPALALGASLVLLACTAGTLRQISYWQTSEKLFRRAVAVTRNNYLAYNNLGFYLSNRGEIDEAIGYYRESLKINPNYEDALNNLGHALAGQGKPEEAIAYYEAALRVRPNHVEVHNNLGNALAELGRGEEAIQHYEFALARKPDHADAHNNLGIALAMRGKLPEAIQHFQAAIRARPGYASARSNLGNAYAVAGQLDEAIEQYRECLRINPNDAQAHNNLANALTQQGKFSEAVSLYRRALELNRKNPEAHYNLALVLLRLTNSAEAITNLQEALRLRPNYEEARKQLEAIQRNPTR